MSLINVDGHIDQNAAAQLATQLAQIIQAAPDTTEKANFIRELATQLGVSAPTQNEDDDDENRVDYRDEHEYECYNDEHEDIEHRGKLVFIDDRCWQEKFANIIFDTDDDDLNDYAACDFEDIGCSCESLDIDCAINNVNDAIEMFKAVKQTLEKCKDNGGEHVIWNNDADFDYDTGDPECI